MSKKVLMVDDQPFILSMGREILEEHGFSVITAKDGLEGIALARNHRPDVIILDVEMPRMDGLETCRFLRQEEAFKNIPIIMFTAKTELVNMEKGFKAGADLYIGKPFNEEKLIALINMVMAVTD